MAFYFSKMFYITYKDDGAGRTKIYSANGDGSNINVIIDESQGYFLGLAVDTDGKYLSSLDIFYYFISFNLRTMRWELWVDLKPN